jgi:cytochrome c oxidase assembly protein subunit 15
MGPLSDSSRRAVAYWLLACCALVFAMVVVGGMTRLTHSGLSIVEWRPVTGTLPPLSEAAWQEEFAKYQASPEFRQRNHDMTLAGFKGIFWWEYFHRLLGRVIGLAFAVPFIWFVARGAVRGALAWKLAGIFLLGGLQGAVGWYMVKSGLDHDPMVSPVRLAMHLGLAILIYAAMLWVALGLLRRTPAAPATPGLRRLALALPPLVFLMVLTGALVAGIRAGYAYNTWPLMNGHLVPPEIWVIEPWWKNLAFNMATVQFNHRTLALVVAACVVAAWWLLRAGTRDVIARRWGHALLVTAALQVSIGIATLLLRVPLPLAALHQAGAVVVLTCALGLAHCLARAGLQR